MPTYTEQQLIDIINATASGAQRVSYGDKTVEYRSLTELRQILSTITGDITGVVPRRTFRMVSPSDKGL